MLVGDGFGKAARDEQGRDPAHGLAVTEEDEAARTYVLEEVLHGGPAGDVVEVDEDVAAEHDVEDAEPGHGCGIDQVGMFEGDAVAQVGVDLPSSPPLDAADLGGPRREPVALREPRVGRNDRAQLGLLSLRLQIASPLLCGRGVQGPHRSHEQEQDLQPSR